MKQRINIPAKVRFAKLSEIILYRDNYDGTATITTHAWHTIPFHEGSIRMTIENNDTDAGRQITTNINGRLKQLMHVRCLGILEVTMCNGDTYIIGTPDLPVTIDQTTTLTQKSFRITHQNTVFPPLMAE